MVRKGGCSQADPLASHRPSLLVQRAIARCQCAELIGTFAFLLRPPTNLALPFLMFGFAQMADGKKPHTRCGLCKAEAALSKSTEMHQPAHQSVRRQHAGSPAFASALRCPSPHRLLNQGNRTNIKYQTAILVVVIVVYDSFKLSMYCVR